MNKKSQLIFFRSLKVLDDKHIEVKKDFELAKAHLSHVEHRVFKNE